MPKSRITEITEGSSELGGQKQLDGIDRSDWPEAAELSDGSESTTEGVAKSANRTNLAKQPGTTGAKPMPYPKIEELRASQKRGNEGRGLPENSVDQLNECQGHAVDIQE